MKNNLTDLKNLHNDSGGLLFGKHNDGAIHAVFGTVDAAYAWRLGLGSDWQYFHIEDRDGNTVLFGGGSRPGHAYAVLEELESAEQREDK